MGSEGSKVVVNVSNRHVHLCQADLEKLFGNGYKLTKLKDLVQPGEHACEETVTVSGGKRDLSKVRILGPLRKFTQVEISKTDSIFAGIEAPVRTSGDISSSASVKITGPKGSVELKEGCIVAKRHVHMTPKDGERLGVKNGQLIKLKCNGERGLIFENVVARVCDNMSFECHIDTDEANSAGIKNGDYAEII